MNIPKKIVAVMSAFLIVLKILLVNASAAFAPILAGEGIVELLIALLSGAGYSSSELSGKSYSELNDLLGECINDGRINSNTVITDPITNAEIAITDFLQSPEVQAGQKAASSVVNSAFMSWLSELLSKLSDIQDYVKPTLKGDINMQGHGALMKVMVLRNGELRLYQYYYCDYITLNIYDDGYFSVFLVNATRVHSDYYGQNEQTTYMGNFASNYPMSELKKYAPISGGEEEGVFLYGDVRNADGTKVETNDEYEYTLGETEDGTKVTVDMLNPDGTVTIDGVTYAPSDYIDLDKFTDTAVDDLIKEINITINNINVAAPDDTKDIVDSIAGDLDISQDLSDYSLPAVISIVFPFCLPFDFVRGMKLFSAEPVTPYFEVEIDVPAFLNIPNQKWKFVIDLEKFETLAKITRWLSVISFSYVLIILSTKIVKGAGA